MQSIGRGTVVGTAILLVGYLAWGLTVYAGASTSFLSGLVLCLPGVAGFGSAWLAPRGQLAPSVLLAVPAAIFAGTVNMALQMAGSDVGFYAGPTGALRVAAWTLMSAGLFSAVGGLLGVIARQVRGTA